LILETTITDDGKPPDSRRNHRNLDDAEWTWNGDFRLTGSAEHYGAIFE
jgi:hypothetical protein